MDEQAFELEHGDLLDAIRRERHGCPLPKVLLEWAERSPEQVSGDGVELHLSFCDDCRELVDRLRRSREEAPEIDDVTWRRAEIELDRRSPPWTQGPLRERRTLTLWLAAAAALLGVTGLWMFGRGPERPVSTVRGVVLQALLPRASTDPLDRFVWRSVAPLDAVYEIEVNRDGRLWWRGRTDQSPFEVPAGVRAALRGGGVSWRVLARSKSGAVIASSDWVELEGGGASP